MYRRNRIHLFVAGTGSWTGIVCCLFPVDKLAQIQLQWTQTTRYTTNKGILIKCDGEILHN